MDRLLTRLTFGLAFFLLGGMVAFLIVGATVLILEAFVGSSSRRLAPLLILCLVLPFFTAYWGFRNGLEVPSMMRQLLARLSWVYRALIILSALWVALVPAYFFLMGNVDFGGPESVFVAKLALLPPVIFWLGVWIKSWFSE